MAVIVVSETILSLHGRALDSAGEIPAAFAVPSEASLDPRVYPSDDLAGQDPGTGFLWPPASGLCVALQP